MGLERVRGRWPPGRLTIVDRHFDQPVALDDALGFSRRGAVAGSAGSVGRDQDHGHGSAFQPSCALPPSQALGSGTTVQWRKRTGASLRTVPRKPARVRVRSRPRSTSSQPSPGKLGRIPCDDVPIRTRPPEVRAIRPVFGRRARKNAVRHSRAKRAFPSRSCAPPPHDLSGWQGAVMYRPMGPPIERAPACMSAWKSLGANRIRIPGQARPNFAMVDEAGDVAVRKKRRDLMKFVFLQAFSRPGTASGPRA